MVANNFMSIVYPPHYVIFSADFLHICKKNDPALQECFKESVLTLKPYLAKGKSKIGHISTLVSIFLLFLFRFNPVKKWISKITTKKKCRKLSPYIV